MLQQANNEHISSTKSNNHVVDDVIEIDRQR